MKIAFCIIGIISALVALAVYMILLIGFIRIFRSDREEKVELNMFDKEEIIENCTVQVLTNTVTGETSVGWWRNEQVQE